MAHISLSSKKVSDFTPCEVHRHASGEFSIVIDGYRFLLPECHSFNNFLEHMIILHEALDRGITFEGDFSAFESSQFDFYDVNKDIKL